VLVGRHEDLGARVQVAILRAVERRDAEGAKAAMAAHLKVLDRGHAADEQAAAIPLVCGIVVHPFIVGQPHRLRPFRRALERIGALGDEVWLTTPGQITQHYTSRIARPAGDDR
jgi:hypothetical protein